MKVQFLDRYICRINHGKYRVVIERNPRKHMDYYAIWGSSLTQPILRVSIDKIPPWRYKPSAELYV